MSETLARLRLRFLDPDPLLNPPIIRTDFKETEPNNTREQADYLGELSSKEVIRISGHLNGQSDPYDYFRYTLYNAGEYTVRMYNSSTGEVMYENTFNVNALNLVAQVWDPYHYWGSATGNADFDYETFIYKTDVFSTTVIA